ncbi:UNVERIFIED_CONTAM: Cellulose synthase A catalytic subunit [UDP-forming] [Sesamum latifolium]|uniref:Cellulose synthase A catalytic subunit [UDP-forming] n=1 Tax=Sesamum latifolium TaxID=2727402 RepID=A0AAW2XTH1_9LAMI
MALDYPPDKLAVYLHDDGGSYVTLNAVREAWKFARFWVPFRRKYELKFPCPEAYFSAEESAHEKFIGSSEFAAEKKIIEKRYAEFQEALEKNSVNASASVSRDHPPVIEVMTDENGDSSLKEMPLLVYVARRKGLVIHTISKEEHSMFYGNHLQLRVSAVISNAPYFMVLDCDMYCNDPSSVRQTMCFYLDPKVSPQIAWVQFPQKFRNLSKHDIYGGSLHHLYVMTDENGDSNLKDMPLLVYVAREKRPGHPHHFKGGALNTLLRVSAVITNAPYFLVLDCDMYCYNPLSARLAMCFYLDPKVASKIAWVQFPQKFHNLSEHDIYGGSLNAIYKSNIGLDGLRGPNIYGCNFVMTREAIYGTGKIEKEVDLNKLKKSFGSSNEFIKSLYKSYKPQLPEDRKPSAELQKELQLLASCTYDNGTDWGEEASTYR